MGSGITAIGSGITDHGIGISSFLGIRDQAVPHFVGSGKKIGHAFGIKDHKFAYKNGISDEKTYLVTTLRCYFVHDIFAIVRMPLRCNVLECFTARFIAVGV